MPFPFQLPTTSALSFHQFFASSTHPSLPTAATTQRGVLRAALKSYKRLPNAAAQTAHLSTVLSAVTDYAPYPFALDAGLSGHPIPSDPSAAGDPEEVDVVLVHELESVWRAPLSARSLGPASSSSSAARLAGEPPRAAVRGLEAELLFVLLTWGVTRCLLARAELHRLQDASAPPVAQDGRAAAIAAAMKHYLDAHAAFAHAAARADGTGGGGGGGVGGGAAGPSSSGSVDISPGVLGALAEMALAEATLIAVLKDDPYPAVVAEGRNRNATDWMFKSPEIPKVRAHLFARLCLRAAEHAARAAALLASSSLGGGGSARVDDALAKYLEDLRRCARAKACRFLGIDAELEGKTGEGIAWLRGARRELGLAGGASPGGGKEDGKPGKLTKLRKEWAERREDKRVESGERWGGDAGRFEEGRVLEMLEGKWVKMNDTISAQIVPPSEPLLANMPSGRAYHTPKPFIPPALDPDVIARMRTPPDPGDRMLRGLGGGGADGAGEDDDEDEDVGAGGRDAGAGTVAGEEGKKVPVGAFPGTTGDYEPSAYY